MVDKFVPFHLETNQIFGDVATKSDWIEYRSKYQRLYPNDNIWDLKQSVHTELPDFGSRSEHKCQKTLSEFFDENGMNRLD